MITASQIHSESTDDQNGLGVFGQYSPICPGTCLPLKRRQRVTLKQLMCCEPSWHCGAVMLMAAGRKMDMSTVMTGLDLAKQLDIRASLSCLSTLE